MKTSTDQPILKTAVIGLGRIGWSFHLPQVAKHEGFALSAVVDPLPERLNEAQERFHPEACYRSCEELYREQKPDLVVIASPTAFHKEQVLQAFEHGCDVFCDKPLTLTLEDADILIEAMQRMGRRLMVYQPHRTGSEARSLQAILSEGRLGQLYFVRHSIARFSRRADWQAFKRNGGGMLNNYGAHFIDQFLFLNGAPFRDFACQLRAVATLGDAEDVVKAVLTAENGVIFDLDINMAAVAPMPTWYIAGSQGAAVFDSETQTWTLTYFEPSELTVLLPQEGLAAQNRSYGNGETIPWKTSQVRADDYPPLDFYDACHAYFAGGRDPLVPIAQTREVMRALRECRKAAGWN